MSLHRLACSGMDFKKVVLAGQDHADWLGMCMQVMQLMEASPFQEDAAHLPHPVLACTVSSGPAASAWAGPGPDLRQLGVDLQWKHSSLNSTESAACSFALSCTSGA